MLDLTGPATRVILRYLSGIFLAHGMASHAGLLADPDFQTVASYGIAAVCSGVSEGWWYLAHKHGWRR